jgi:hypothetical protein
MAKKKSGKRKRKTTSGTYSRGPRERPDPRTRHTHAVAENGVEYPEPHRLVIMQPLRTGSGENVYFPAPFAWVLLIDVARQFRDRGEQARRRAWRSLVPFADGEASVDEVSSNDATAYLSAAVVLAFNAIEAYANEQIERLPETATVKRGSEEIAKADMARRLNIDDKLKKAIPQLLDRKAVAGDATLWGRFVALKDLRDEIVHLKERGYSTDLDAPSAYARLMQGDAATCPEDAADLIYEIEGQHWPEGSEHLVRADRC